MKLVAVAATVLAFASLSSLAVAGPMEDGIAAYKAGDYASALRQWLPLAESGDARAENNVGVLYEKGLGVQADLGLAKSWYQKAAVQGHSGAQRNLAELSSKMPNGDGVQADQPPPPASPILAAHLPGTKLAGVGDIVLRVETSEPLPNVFGKPDIFGRRRPTGVATLQFAGLRDDKAIFIRTGVSIQSNATTMTESPRYVPLFGSSTYSGMVGTTPYFGSGSAMGGVWAPPRGSQAVETQLPPIEIDVDWQRDPVVVVSGKRLIIEAVTGTTLTYAVAK
jgi:hypothetical protein